MQNSSTHLAKTGKRISPYREGEILPREIEFHDLIQGSLLSGSNHPIREPRLTSKFGYSLDISGSQ
jgi:hypothetical protein